MTLPKMLPDRVKVYYRHMSTAKLALKYHKTEDAMRQWLHREGINDPKHEYHIRQMELVRKYRVEFRWFIHEIAEQLEISCHKVRLLVKCVYRRAFNSIFQRKARPCVQLKLINPDLFTYQDAPPMRIVHSARPKVHGPSGQLELFPVELLKILAA